MSPNPLMPAVLPGGGLIYVEAYTPDFFPLLRGLSRAETCVGGSLRRCCR